LHPGREPRSVAASLNGCEFWRHFNLDKAYIRACVAPPRGVIPCLQCEPECGRGAGVGAASGRVVAACGPRGRCFRDAVGGRGSPPASTDWMRGQDSRGRQRTVVPAARTKQHRRTLGDVRSDVTRCLATTSAAAATSRPFIFGAHLSAVTRQQTQGGSVMIVEYNGPSVAVCVISRGSVATRSRLRCRIVS